MRDGLGRPQSLAVLGGTSDIGRAVAAELARSRCRRVVLAGRDQVRLERAADQLKVAGATQVRTTLFEATDRSGHDRLVADVFGQGDVDVVLFAFGELGDQDALTEDADAAARLADVNDTATVSLGLRVAKAMRGQGHGTLVFLSSVAAQRGRRSTFVYGSTKAGVDTFAQGLGDSLHRTGVHVVVVRPGFVRTRMTAGRPAPPFATTPDAVARAVAQAVSAGQETVWVPRSLRAVMSGVRALPRPVFRRLRF